MKVGVLGYGLIGKERVQALQQLRAEGSPMDLIAVCDPYAAGEKESLGKGGVVWCPTLEEMLALALDWVIVASPHDVAVAAVEKILPTGVKVLMEKPFGRSFAEAQRLAAQQLFPDQISVGFNYRFMPGIAALLADVRAGRYGSLISVHMVLGHGGSPGMEKGWKFDPEKAGGGCLIDPGVHLLDLCCCISPGLKLSHLGAWSGFWNTGIEEEAHLLLQGGATIFNVQVSVVRWRSTFLLEVHGTEGYGVVTGRGRSYGPQRFRRGRRWGWLGGMSQEQSEEEVCVSDCRESFRDELHVLFQGAFRSDAPHPCRADEALEVMRLYQDCLEKL
jgi:predicted dehydrogenase